MPEEAVASPIEEMPVETTPAETTETTNAPETAATDAKPAESEAKSALTESQKAISHLKELKKTDPELARAFKAKYFEAEALRKEFPEGLKAIRETMAQIEQFGGLEQLPQIKEQAEELSRIDQLYDSADPGFVDGMIESNPESFKALMPIAVEKWKESDFDSYASIVAKDVLASFESTGVRTAIESLRQAAAAHPELADHVKTLIGFYNGLYEQSQKQAAKPGAAKDGKDPIAEERQSLERERQQITVEKWNGVVKETHRDIFNAEMSKIMQGKAQPSDQQRAAIGELYMGRMQRAAADPKHRQTVDRYLAAKDQDGYKRYMQGFYKQNLPRALSSAVDAVIGRAPRAAAAAKPATNGKVATSAAKPGSLFNPGQRPDVKNVDFSRTTRDMFYKEKKAFTKDGKRISWT